MALILALGRIGGLWYLLSKLPPFNGFKHAFKFIPFATLFMMLGGALLLERALRHWKFNRRLFESSVVAAVALLFTGRYPSGLYDLVMGVNRWIFRVIIYVGQIRRRSSAESNSAVSRICNPPAVALATLCRLQVGDTAD